MHKLLQNAGQVDIHYADGKKKVTLKDKEQVDIVIKKKWASEVRKDSMCKVKFSFGYCWDCKYQVPPFEARLSSAAIQAGDPEVLCNYYERKIVFEKKSI